MKTHSCVADRFYFLLQLTALLSSMLLAVDGHAQAQPPAFNRAVICGSMPLNNGGLEKTAVDIQGNVYTMGSFMGSITIGGFTLTSTNPSTWELFVARLDATTGAYVWAVKAGGAGGSNTNTNAIAVDKAGHVYVAGGFNSASVSFGRFMLTATVPGDYDAFVAQLDAATGTWNWAVQCSGVGSEQVDWLTTDVTGNVYVAGKFFGPTATFGSYTATKTAPNAMVSDVFIAKLNASGAWQWATQEGARYGSNIEALATDTTGHLYATGGFYGRTSFGSTLALTATRGDMYVARLDGTTGTWQWVVRADASDTINGCGASSMAVDAAGHLYIAGNFNSFQNVFGGTTLTNSSLLIDPLVSPVYYLTDVFVARLDAATGAWQWAVSAGGRGDDECQGLALDANGNVYALGSFAEPPPPHGGPSGSQFGSTTLFSSRTAGTTFLAKLNAAGNWQWAAVLPGYSYPGHRRPIGIDGNANLHISGGFDTSITLGTISLTAQPGFTTGFVARLAVSPLAAHLGQPLPPFTVWPNPARTAVSVSGLPAGQAVQLLDILGRTVLQTAMPSRGPLELALPAALPAGLYLVRAGGQSKRLVIE